MWISRCRHLLEFTCSLYTLSHGDTAQPSPSALNPYDSSIVIRRLMTDSMISVPESATPQISRPTITLISMPILSSTVTSYVFNPTQLTWCNYSTIRTNDKILCNAVCYIHYHVVFKILVICVSMWGSHFYQTKCDPHLWGRSYQN